MKILRRPIYPVVKVLDEKKGIAEYVASDHTPDSYREVIRADGWRFDHFQKNAPFVDSHDYSSLDKLVGKVTDFQVKGRQLVETVQWAIDVPENRLAQLGWKMTAAGFLKAVSVGFFPVKAASRYDANPTEFRKQMSELGIEDGSNVQRIFTEQQQIELSAVIIGANPNALAKAYKAEAVTDDDLKFVDSQLKQNFPDAEVETAHPTASSALVEWADARTTEAFWKTFENLTKQI